MKIRKLMNSKPAQKIFNWGLKNAPFALPIKPQCQTTHWIAFNHPNSSYPVHILVVPKVQLQDWLSIKSNDIEIDMMREFIDLTQSLIQEYGLTDTGYRLILNGGNYQTFPHLHVHLVSGDATTTQA